jgi:hypothetical protein
VRIAHLCLSNFYIDGFGYQENDLVREHVAAGHDVLVIASTETIENGKLTYVEPRDYVGGDGARVIRVAYRRWLPQKVMRKLRMNAGVERLLEQFRPDTILFHGTCGWEVRTAARYARAHPATLFYVDSHEDAYNSARTFASRELLHRPFYRPVLRSVLRDVRKILCVSTETIDFVNNLYGVPRDMLELYPLGGHPVGDEEYGRRRAESRASLALAEGDIAIVQSGKQTRRKKLLESLAALRDTPGQHLRLFIAGTLDDDIRDEAERSIAADSRVTYLGWQSRDALTSLLCAADVYLQPGTQSVTMQHSLCCRCAVILDDVPSHRIYQRDNGWFIAGEEGLGRALAELATAPLPAMQANSYAVAKEMLDYKVLAERVLR